MFKPLNGQLTSTDLLVSVVIEPSRVLSKIVHCVVQLIAVVCLPCFSEAFALPPEKVLAELSNGNIVSREVLLKESSGVFGAHGVLEKDKGILKSGNEVPARSSQNNQAIINKNANQTKKTGDQSGEDWDWYIYVCMLLPWIWTLSPNV